MEVFTYKTTNAAACVLPRRPRALQVQVDTDRDSVWSVIQNTLMYFSLRFYHFYCIVIRKTRSFSHQKQKKLCHYERAKDRLIQSLDQMFCAIESAKEGYEFDQNRIKKHATSQQGYLQRVLLRDVLYFLNNGLTDPTNTCFIDEYDDISMDTATIDPSLLLPSLARQRTNFLIDLQEVESKSQVELKGLVQILQNAVTALSRLRRCLIETAQEEAVVGSNKLLQDRLQDPIVFESEINSDMSETELYKSHNIDSLLYSGEGLSTSRSVNAVVESGVVDISWDWEGVLDELEVGRHRRTRRSV